MLLNFQLSLDLSCTNTFSRNRAITLEFRPAEFLWFQPGPPKTQFGVKGTYRKLVKSSTTFEKSGFPVSGSGFNKKSGNFMLDLELQSNFKSDV